MPIVSITLIEGRTTENKAAIMTAVTEALVQALPTDPSGVRVMLHEVLAENYSVAGIAMNKMSTA